MNQKFIHTFISKNRPKSAVICNMNNTSEVVTMAPVKKWLAYEMAKEKKIMKIQLSPGVPYLQISVILAMNVTLNHHTVHVWVVNYKHKYDKLSKQTSKA